MKKLVFVALAAVALMACNPTEKSEGKCTDSTELQEAIINHSTDTSRYDLNLDGRIDTSDVSFMVEQLKASDTTAVTKL